MVLNGNGRRGAAAAAASRVRSHGYRIGDVGNAARMSYSRSLVMYRPGFEGEGRRLGRDLGIRLVGPLDGMRGAQLHGAQVVLILGETESAERTSVADRRPRASRPGICA